MSPCSPEKPRNNICMGADTRKHRRTGSTGTGRHVRGGTNHAHTRARECGRCTSKGTTGCTLYTRHVPQRSQLTPCSNLRHTPHPPPQLPSDSGSTSHHHIVYMLLVPKLHTDLMSHTSPHQNVCAAPTVGVHTTAVADKIGLTAYTPLPPNTARGKCP